MAHKTTYSMKFRRRREGKTDYRKRLRLLKSKKPRLVIRITNENVVAQVIKYKPEGDEVVTTATTKHIQDMGYKGHGGNAEAAYLTGRLCGKKAVKKGVKHAVLDIGLHTPVNGSNTFAALKGAIDAGIEIPHNEKCFPKKEDVKTKAGKKALEKIKKE